MIQQMLAIWFLVPLPFLNPACTFGSSWLTYCWSLAWRILSITLLVCEMSPSHDHRTRLSNFTFPFHFHALGKELATHSSILAWRIPGTGEPGGLLSMGSHRVGHDWSDLAAAAPAAVWAVRHLAFDNPGYHFRYCFEWSRIHSPHAPVELYLWDPV